MASPLLSGENLSLSLQKRTLFSDVNFSLHPGEILGLSGRSGEGKSTFLRALAALLKFERGSLHFKQTPLHTWDIPTYRKHVLYLPQTPALQGQTVQEALDYPFQLKTYAQTTPTPLDPSTLGLPPTILQQSLQFLSGGERQRIQLWRALQLNPQILLLDEPTSALDKTTQEQVESIIQHWVQKGERACVWISHDAMQLKRIQSTPFQLSAPLSKSP